MNSFKYTPLEKPIPIGSQSWEKDVSPIVTINCNTYNHEPYIEDTIEGFLKQKTTFPTQILIFEDCSTDRTAAIIRNYEQKHPALFKVFYMKENTYKKPIRAKAKEPFYKEQNKSKYIAMCEGDDYWTDPLKLQKQVELMEKHPNCSMCFHDYKKKFLNRNNEEVLTGPQLKENHIFSSEEIIQGKYFIRLVTLMMKTSVAQKLPHWTLLIPHGDFALQLFGATQGDIGYIGGGAMAVYNRGTSGAWSDDGQSKSKDIRKKWEQKRLNDHMRTFEIFNKHTNNKYALEMKKRRQARLLSFLHYHSKDFTENEKRRLLRKYSSVFKDYKNKPLLALWLKLYLGERVYKFLVG